MPFQAGARLGPYEVLGAIGAGGMGEVYKGRDTRLDRIVALKVIQPAAATSAEMRERFEREARAISALDHPHICILYDVCREGDVSFLVMQYLEGETLADRLARAGRPPSDPSRPQSGGDSAMSTISRGPISFETTLKYAAEIAHALDAAHRRGIVHRDLKPGNVMLTKAGTKLLDFGLAKLADSGPGPAVDATRTSPLTSQGAILGTLQYMAPEQLEGRDVDARADIHAFGAVLFEMLSGRRAFESQSQAGLIAAIIGSDPPPLTTLADARTTLPVVAQRALDRLIARCLAKNPDDRWQSAADLAAELHWINEERLRAAPEIAASAPVADFAAGHASRRQARIWMSVAGAAMIGLAALAIAWYPRPAPPPAPVTFMIEAPAGESISTGPGLASVSPDGQRVAFTTGGGTSTKLWIRNLDSLTVQRVVRADAAWHPAWSPDGHSIAYTEASGAAPLRKVDLATGTVSTLAPDGNGRVAWSPSGVILFESGNKLLRVKETGGTPELAMDRDPSRKETTLSWPVFLPDGRHYLFVGRSSVPSNSALFLASLDAPGRTLLLNVLSSVEYAGGYLFYQSGGTLVAHPFDPDAGRLTGDVFPVVENIRYNAGNGRAAVSVSSSGVLVYVTGEDTNNASGRRVMLSDRFGKSARQIGPSTRYSSAMLSPDGRQAVVSIDGEQSTNRMLSLLDLERGLLMPFTVGDVDERSPIWSRDGSAVVFTSIRDGNYGLYRRSAAGGATRDELLFAAAETMSATGFSPDGTVLLMTRGGGANQRIWALPLTGQPAGEPKPVELFPGGTMAQYQATFSYDGKWIAYGMGPGPGEGEIYVAPYPVDDRRKQISTATGRFPYWTEDGRHIIYRTTKGDVMWVELTPDGRSFRVSNPTTLFAPPVAAPGNWSYSTDARAEKILLVAPAEKAPVETSPPLTVIVNWVASLKKKP